jgi:hypothetical protein
LASWREEKKRAKTQRRKEKIDAFAACLPQAGLAPLRAKKENLHVYHIGQNRYQKKLACHWQGVKKITPLF